MRSTCETWGGGGGGGDGGEGRGGVGPGGGGEGGGGVGPGESPAGSREGCAVKPGRWQADQEALQVPATLQRLIDRGDKLGHSSRAAARLPARRCASRVTQGRQRPNTAQPCRMCVSVRWRCGLGPAGVWVGGGVGGAGGGRVREGHGSPHVYEVEAWHAQRQRILTTGSLACSLM